jgi:hypothetical protein
MITLVSDFWGVIGSRSLIQTEHADHPVL